MKSLVLLTALLLVGCSIEVVHETKNKFQTESQTESLSTSDKSKTVVVVNILNELTPETRHTVSDTPSTKRSTTIVEVVVPEPSPEVVNSLPTPRRPEPTIQISGYGSVPMEYPESDTRRVSSPRETPRQTTLQKVKTKRRPRNTEYTEGVLAFFRVNTERPSPNSSRLINCNRTIRSPSIFLVWRNTRMATRMRRRRRSSKQPIWSDCTVRPTTTRGWSEFKVLGDFG